MTQLPWTEPGSRDASSRLDTQDCWVDGPVVGTRSALEWVGDSATPDGAHCLARASGPYADYALFSRPGDAKIDVRVAPRGHSAALFCEDPFVDIDQAKAECQRIDDWLSTLDLIAG